MILMLVIIVLVCAIVGRISTAEDIENMNNAVQRDVMSASVSLGSPFLLLIVCVLVLVAVVFCITSFMAFG